MTNGCGVKETAYTHQSKPHGYSSPDRGACKKEQDDWFQLDHGEAVKRMVQYSASIIDLIG